MSFAKFIIGPSLAVLRSMPAASVDLVLTSPPFLALRSYLPADHPDKALEVGSEPTPGEFIDTLLDHVEACERVLAPHGSLVFELGDTYAGSGGAGGDYAEGGQRDGQPMFRAGYLRNDRESRVPQETPKAAGKPTRHRSPGADPKYAQRGEQAQGTGAGGAWPLDKSLCLIPEIFRFSLVYGFNPLTGRQTPPWRARNVIRWCRPNPPVGALRDKVRPGTSDMVVVCKGRKRYFDLDAVRTPHKEGEPTPATAISRRRALNRSAPGNHTEDATEGITGNPAGAPPLDHWWHDEDTFDQDAWLIPTHGYPGAHYATWPAALLVKPILSMCPPKVCRTCGKPSERIVDISRAASKDDRTRVKASGRLNGHDHPPEIGWEINRTTTGWTDCGHDTWRPGLVLDPFAGTGTTLAVATGHGRDAIGIDIDARNADLARQRVGMWLTEVVDTRELTA